MISCDNKAKIPLGLPCVNRLSSLSHKFFIEGPNFQDHDLRTGYLINPEGYLVLEFNSDCIDEELYLYELNVEGTTQETVDLSETHEHANQYLPYTLDEQLQSQYQQDVPWSNSIDPLVSENNDEIMPEVIIQTDGAASSASSDEFGEDYDFPQANMKRHIRIVSDEEQCDSDRDHDTDSDSEEDIILNSEDIDSVFIEPGADKIIERNGRKHIKIPATGLVPLCFTNLTELSHRQFLGMSMISSQCTTMIRLLNTILSCYVMMGLTGLGEVCRLNIGLAGYGKNLILTFL